MCQWTQSSPKVPFRLSRSGSRVTKPHASKWGWASSANWTSLQGTMLLWTLCRKFWVRYSHVYQYAKNQTKPTQGVSVSARYLGLCCQFGRILRWYGCFFSIITSSFLGVLVGFLCTLIFMKILGFLLSFVLFCFCQALCVTRRSQPFFKHHLETK